MGEPTEPPALPKSIELLWGLDEPGARGPRRGLTLGQVVDAAVAVADADGFAAVSMARVAKELGFTTMSLYRYVDSKETLVELMSDRIIGTPPRLDPGLHWRDALHAWATAEFEAIMRHAWWLDVPLNTPPAGPNNMAWLEAGLNALAPTPLPEPLKLQMVMNMSLYVISRAGLARQLSTAPDGGTAGFEVMLDTMLDEQRFPSLKRALRGRAFDEMDENTWETDDLKWGLDRLLDGYERFVEQF